MRLLFAMLLLTAPCAFPQKVAAVRAGMLYYAERGVMVDGVHLATNGRSKLPRVANGQTVSAEAHAEFLMGPESVLWLHENSHLRFDDTSVAEGKVTLLDGSLFLEIRQTEAERPLIIDASGHRVQVFEAGVYRVDAEPWRVRVYDGNLIVDGTAGKLSREKEATAGGTTAFQPDMLDEFQAWAAYRSLLLEKESGRQQRWKINGQEWGAEARHSGFHVRSPYSNGGARIKYLASGEAGTIYSLTGNARLSSDAKQEVRTPLRIGPGNDLFTEGGRAQVFLGPGVTAYLTRGTRLGMVSVNTAAPVVRLENGSAVIEIGIDREAPRVSVQVGSGVTELTERGVYEFDLSTEGQALLRVFEGESNSDVEGRRVRGRSGQVVNLMQAGPAAKFDTGSRDRLMEWSAARSFELFVSQAGFMTNWKSRINERGADHKVFGERYDGRIQPRRPVPPPQPLEKPRAPRAADNVIP